MFQKFKSLILFPLQLQSSFSLRECVQNYPWCSLVHSLARFNIPLSRICTEAYEVDFRPRQVAYVLQYTDFFTYNRCRTILTGMANSYIVI